MARSYGNGIAVTTDGGGAVNPASHTHAATDAYDNDAFLVSFDVHYEIDAFGSDEEYTK